MPNTHFAVSWVDGAAVSKSNIRNGFRDYVPLYCTVAELQALTAANTRCALVNGAAYYYDSTDSTSADDGVNVIVSADGKRYKPLVLGTPRVIDVTDNTNPAMKITQRGTADALRVEDQASDTTPVLIDANGRLVIGSTAGLALSALSVGTPSLEVVGSTAAAASLAILMHSTGSPAQAFLGRSKTTTIGGQTAVAAGDFCGQLVGLGSDGTDFQQLAALVLACDATPSAGVVPGRAVLRTANSSGVLTDRLRADSSGNVRIGTGAPSVTLDVDGPIRVKSYTVGTVPAAATAAGQITYVSNEAGGATTAFSDGTNWRRHSDRAVIS